MKILKFRAGNKNDIDALEKHSLWFSELSKLNDPYEGWIIYDFQGISHELRVKLIDHLLMHFSQGVSLNERLIIEQIKYQPDELKSYVDSRMEGIFSEFYFERYTQTSMCSLSYFDEKGRGNHPVESMMLWSHYGNGFQGFCLEFDFSKIVDSYSVSEKAFAYKNVSYSSTGAIPTIEMKDFYIDTLLGRNATSIDILKAFFHKDYFWKYENEIRLISGNAGLRPYNPNSLSSIYIPEKVSEDKKKSIVKNVRATNPKTKIYNVLQDRNEYKLRVEEIYV